MKIKKFLQEDGESVAMEYVIFVACHRNPPGRGGIRPDRCDADLFSAWATYFGAGS